MAKTIPRGWQELEFKDFLKYTPREVEKPKEKYRALGIRSHCKGTFIREVENPDKVMMESLYAVKKDDLIVNITFAWEGAVALINKSDEGALVSHRFPTYVFNRNVVIPEFFKYLIPSKRFVYNLGVISPGGAGRNRVLDRKDFLHLQFIMPPVEEQKKIAEILSSWDRAIETLDKLTNAQIYLKNGLTQTLLTGKVRLNGFEGEKWKKIRLGDWGEIIRGVSYKPQTDLKQADELNTVRLLRANNILKRNLNDEDIQFVVNERVSDKQILKTGDIVLCMANGSKSLVGKSAPFKGNDRFAYTVGAFCAIYRPQEIQNSGYVFQLFQSAKYRANIKVLLVGSSINNLRGADINDQRFTVSMSSTERAKIANILSSVDSEIQMLSTKYKLLESQKNGLLQKLLTGKIRVKI